ncbi:hypothetical protein IWQ61_010694, partial [Dispira simplex]
ITRPRATKAGSASQQGASHQRSKSSNVEPSSWKTASSRMGNVPTGQIQVGSSFTPQPKVPLVRSWATGNPGTDCLSAKVIHMSTEYAFRTVLGDLRPEFWKLRPLFLKLREILFDWDVGQGVENTRRKRKAVDEGIDENPPSKRRSGTSIYSKTNKELEMLIRPDTPAEPEDFINEYCQRLLDREAEKDRIVEKFMDAIDNFKP